MRTSIKRTGGVLGLLRVVLYVRLSRQDKIARARGTIESCAVQREDGTSAIEAEPEFTLVKVIEHDDLSGTRVDRLDEIRAMAHRKEFDVLAIRDLERFARFEEPARTMALLQELHDSGVRLWDYRERTFVPISGPEAIVTFVKAMTAGAYVTSNRRNILDGLRKRAEKGQAMHGPPFGYRTNHETMQWEKVDEDVAIVRLVVKTFLRLRCSSATASALNDAGVRSATGVSWRQNMVKALLVQRLYRGEYVYGKTATELRAGKRVSVARDESEWIRVPHPELRLITLDEEQEIDRILAMRSRPWGTKRRHLATPYLSCAICRGSIASSARSYTCDRHRMHGCLGVGYRSQTVIDAALLRLVARLVRGEVIAEACAVLREEANAPDTRTQERERIARELAAAQRIVSNLTGGLEEASTGPMRAPILARLRDQSERKAALQAALARLDARVLDLDARRAIEALEARIRGVRAGLASAAPEEQHAAIRAVLGEDRVRVSRVLGEDGRPRWEMRAKADGRFLLGDRADLISDRMLKLAVKGDVSGVNITPVTTPAAPAPSPAAQPAPSEPATPPKA